MTWIPATYRLNLYKSDVYKRQPLKKGQIVSIEKKKDALPFPILYEDKELIVIDKPCGLLSEATAKESQKTAYAIVKKYLTSKNENIFLVHRLDQYTSGILMFVKSKRCV